MVTQVRARVPRTDLDLFRSLTTVSFFKPFGTTEKGDKYKNCRKTRGSTWAENMEARKRVLQSEYKLLASSTSYEKQT